MFSQKTNNTRIAHVFLILAPLLLLDGSILGLLANQVATRLETDTRSVKNETVLVDDQAQIAEDITTQQEIVVADEKPTITIYSVKEGDTISTIAEQFSISTNTLLWANDLTRTSKIKVGQKLTILPVTGVQYEVKKGDTISGIAKKFDGDSEEILSYNDLESANKIVVGMTLIIPNGELPATKQVVAKTTAPATKKVTPATISSSTIVSTKATPDADDAINNGAVPPVSVRNVATDDYFIHPVPGSTLTQGLHGYNSVDFGAPTGTPILAAADGVVIIEKGAGKWYGGYGNYIVIEHDNGTQTLYSHNSKNIVNVGDTVKQGQTIALVGSTGRSTGPHLHFEVRGGKNPWVGQSKGTKY